jgi:hypothetical protein
VRQLETYLSDHDLALPVPPSPHPLEPSANQ